MDPIERTILIEEARQALAHCVAMRDAGRTVAASARTHPAVRRCGQFQAECYHAMAEIYRRRIERLSRPLSDGELFPVP